MGNAVARVNGVSYKILGTLGEGDAATVYEVVRRRSGDKRHCALKWIRNVRDTDVLERLQREIRVHWQLRHANILPIVDAQVRASDDINSQLGTQAHDVLLLVPICAHGSLQTQLDDAFHKRITPFSERECLRLFAAIVAAVQHVHALGFAHGALTPSNVLLSDASPTQPLLMNFGALVPLNLRVLGRVHHAALCNQTATNCHAAYCPPELQWPAATAQHVAVLDGRADVWQLGCLLYAMAFGPQAPFERVGTNNDSSDNGLLYGAVQFPTPQAARFSHAFTSLITSLLTPDATRRPTLDVVQRHVEQLRAVRTSGPSAHASVIASSSSVDGFSISSDGLRSPYSDKEPVPEVAGGDRILSMSPPPPTQVLSFTKLTSDAWNGFAPFEKRRQQPIMVNNASDTDTWTADAAAAAAAAGRSTSTSVMSVGTLVWSSDTVERSSIALESPSAAGAPQQANTQQRRRRRHSIGALAEPQRSGDWETRHALLSSHGRLLLSQALDNRASQ